MRVQRPTRLTARDAASSPRGGCGPPVELGDQPRGGHSSRRPPASRSLEGRLGGHSSPRAKTHRRPTGRAPPRARSQWPSRTTSLAAPRARTRPDSPPTHLLTHAARGRTASRRAPSGSCSSADPTSAARRQWADALLPSVGLASDQTTARAAPAIGGAPTGGSVSGQAEPDSQDQAARKAVEAQRRFTQARPPSPASAVSATWPSTWRSGAGASTTTWPGARRQHPDDREHLRRLEREASRPLNGRGCTRSGIDGAGVTAACRGRRDRVRLDPALLGPPIATTTFCAHE